MEVLELELVCGVPFKFRYSQTAKSMSFTCPWHSIQVQNTHYRLAGLVVSLFMHHYAAEFYRHTHKVVVKEAMATTMCSSSPCKWLVPCLSLAFLDLVQELGIPISPLLRRVSVTLSRPFAHHRDQRQSRSRKLKSGATPPEWCCGAYFPSSNTLLVLASGCLPHEQLCLRCHDEVVMQQSRVQGVIQ